MRLAVVAMDLDDISDVLEIDRESYSVPWPASAYRREILHNRNARYVVLREVPDGVEIPVTHEPRPRMPWPFFRKSSKADDSGHGGGIVGYAGMWMMLDEAHITTIALRTALRGQGLGELLLATLIETAIDLGAVRVTLEVRVSNDVAQNLYRKYGFRQEGVRPRYYSDNNEDAYIMTTDNIQSLEYRRSFDEHSALLHRRLVGRQMMVESPALSTHATTDAE